MIRAGLLAIFCTVALLPAGPVWGQTEGTAYVSTAVTTTHANCDNPAGALQWTFHYTCQNACGESYHQGERQGSADGYCFIRTFGSNTFCSPEWGLLNKTLGPYGVTSAWSKGWQTFVGCVKLDPENKTEIHCGTAPECNDGTSDGGGGTGGPLDDDTGGGGGGVPTGGDGCTYACTPIVIHLGQDVSRMSGLDDPVRFDIDADSLFETLSWTERGSNTAFLAFDRNGDGAIGGGDELFGGATPQPIPQGEDRNGYRALAVFDGALLGGNEDGWITADDAAFDDLRLWFDVDHDAVSQEHELFTLAEYGIEAIELSHVEHRRRDRHGNEFRYSSRVRFEGGRTTRAVDVFLLNGTP